MNENIVAITNQKNEIKNVIERNNENRLML
jgi:hypothetical protein